VVQTPQAKRRAQAGEFLGVAFAVARSMFAHATPPFPPPCCQQDAMDAALVRRLEWLQAWLVDVQQHDADAR